MNDYISRQAVLDLIYEQQAFYENERKESDHYGSEMECVGSINALTAMEDGLSDIPSANVRPVVHGEWIFDSEWWDYVCTNCKGRVNNSKGYDFCPHCCADMRKESN